MFRNIWKQEKFQRLKATSTLFINRIFFIVFVLILCAPNFFRLPGVKDFLAGRAPVEGDPWLARVENIFRFPASFEKFYNGYFPIRDSADPVGL